MPRAMFPLKRLRYAPHIYPRVKPRRVHLVHRGREYQVHARRLQFRQVRIHIARVRRKVFARRKLRGVNEYADRDRGILSPRPPNQRHMPLMQIAHRWHKAQRHPRPPMRRPELGYRLDNAHHRSALTPSDSASPSAPSISASALGGIVKLSSSEGNAPARTSCAYSATAQPIAAARLA